MKEENNPIQSYGKYKTRNGKIVKHLIIVIFIICILNKIFIINIIKEKTKTIEINEVNSENTGIIRKQDVLYDDLILNIKSLYQVPGFDKKIIADCRIVHGQGPKTDDILYLESANSSEVVYEARVVDVFYYYDLKDRSQGVEISLFGVDKEEIAEFSEVRRKK